MTHLWSHKRYFAFNETQNITQSVGLLCDVTLTLTNLMEVCVPQVSELICKKSLYNLLESHG